MSIFERFRRWLKGSFVCKKCGREFYTMFFGFGEAVCPDCYNGEQPFIFFDSSYWLNRVTAHLLNQRAPLLERASHDPESIGPDLMPPAIELKE